MDRLKISDIIKVADKVKEFYRLKDVNLAAIRISSIYKLYYKIPFSYENKPSQAGIKFIQEKVTSYYNLEEGVLAGIDMNVTVKMYEQISNDVQLFEIQQELDLTYASFNELVTRLGGTEDIDLRTLVHPRLSSSSDSHQPLPPLPPFPPFPPPPYTPGTKCELGYWAGGKKSRRKRKNKKHKSKKHV
jgi:hypothetical protein